MNPNERPPGYETIRRSSPLPPQGAPPYPNAPPPNYPRPAATGYYPAPPTMAPPTMVPAPAQQQQHRAIVVINQPQAGFGGPVKLGADPITFHCPYCQNHVTTSVEYRAGTLAWIVAALVCLFFWPLFFVPLLIDGLKDVDHYCPVCNNRIGTYQRLSG